MITSAPCGTRTASVELVLKQNDRNELQAQLVHVHDLSNGNEKPLKRVEGIAFTETGDLLVLTAGRMVGFTIRTINGKT